MERFNLGTDSGSVSSSLPGEKTTLTWRPLVEYTGRFDAASVPIPLVKSSSSLSSFESSFESGLLPIEPEPKPRIGFGVVEEVCASGRGFGRVEVRAEGRGRDDIAAPERSSFESSPLVLLLLIAAAAEAAAARAADLGCRCSPVYKWTT